LFTKDPEVVAIGEEYLLIVSFFYIIFGTMFVVNGTLRGAGDTLIPMFITLFSLWFVRIPLSYYLSTRMGITGIWWGIPIAWFLGMTLSYLYYLSGKWKSKVVVKPLQKEP
ncbi:MAG: MATE family efflux transporter, partial [Bacteroidales bacterium]|nr:MATE family efflux transporter [Bacteroidales bacterium]